MSSFVSLGNATQPFSRLLQAVHDVRALLPLPLIIQHGATPPTGVFSHADTVLHPYISMTAFEAEVASARLLILHAGAGSVLHAVRAGKRPIVMPRRQHLGEHVDDHQLEFARALSESGHVLLAETAADLPKAIALALATPDAPPQARMDNDMLRLVSATLDGYAAQVMSRTEQRK